VSTWFRPLWFDGLQYGLWRHCYVVSVLRITKGESLQRWSVCTNCDRVAGWKRFSKRIVEQHIEVGGLGVTQMAPLALFNRNFLRTRGAC
jgi:hypothetical protein